MFWTGAMGDNFEKEPWLQKPFNEFATAFMNNRLPGSVILSCPDGTGGERLAAAMAKMYLCHAPAMNGACNNCPSCRAFDNGRHADFVHVRAVNAKDASSAVDHDPDSSEAVSFFFDEDAASSQRYVRIDALRTMQRLIGESSVLGPSKVALISDAHLMQTGAANAVLKTFEEPPAPTLIIMQSRSLDALLPTVLSRAFKIRVSAPDFKTAFDYLKLSDPNYDEAKLELSLALCNCAPFATEKFLMAQCRSGRKEAFLIDEIMKALNIFSDALLAKSPLDDATSAFKALPSQLCAAVLQHFVLEILKYKAHMDPKDLHVIRSMPLDLLSHLPAEHLFKAAEDLKYIAVKAPLLPSRAPYALIRAWLQALVKKS